MDANTELSPSPRWSNTSLWWLSAVLLGLFVTFHVVWDQAIIKVATDGLEPSWGWFSVLKVVGVAVSLMGFLVGLWALLEARIQVRLLFFLPSLLGAALLASPSFGALAPASKWTKTETLTLLRDLREQGHPSSDEARLLTALRQKDEASLERAFYALSPLSTKRLIKLQESMGMDTHALKAKGFAEQSDVEAAIDFSREHNAEKPIQAELYALLTRTTPLEQRIRIQP